MLKGKYENHAKQKHEKQLEETFPLSFTKNMLFLTHASGYYPLSTLPSTYITYLVTICFASWKKKRKKKKEAQQEVVLKKCQAKNEKKVEYKLGSVFIKKKKRDSRKYTSRNSETISLRSNLRLENLNFLLAAVQNLFFLFQYIQGWFQV